MADNRISIDRILSRLDEHFAKNDYISAQKHLLYWLDESRAQGDGRVELLLLNELIGLKRKQAEKEKALFYVDLAISKVTELGAENNLGGATTFLNAGTAYKAFGMSEKAIPVFEKARKIYERELEGGDRRLGGLYNNMALALVDLERYSEAYECYERAISVMQGCENGELEVAITYLNIASAKEQEQGIEIADEQIQAYLEKSRALIENYEKRDGYYAFVCEKCAPTFGYYGHFYYENELKERARRIYEGN